MADPRLEDPADAEDGLAASSTAGDSRRPASAKPRRTRGAAKAEAAPSQGPPSPRQGAAATEDWLADISRLSYQEARTALELALAKLQSSELEVEDMAGLYRRAQAYAERCETVLQQVEQDVIQWDPQTLAPPAP